MSLLNSRQAIWNAGGVRFVTSRILIVDMLNGLIPWDRLGGILYYMTPGTLINENSTENFILRVYAQHVYRCIHAKEVSKSSEGGSVSSLPVGAVAFDGYNSMTDAAVPETDVSCEIHIKAFTETPWTLSHGWNVLEKVLHDLKVGTKVFFFPRFRRSIKECLTATPPETAQILVDMAPIQTEIHNNLLIIFKKCIDDLKERCGSGSSLSADISNIASRASSSVGGAGATGNASSSTNSTMQEISYGAALFAQFDASINAILEPLGSKVPTKVRALLQDIKIVRDLLRMLIRCDAVQFYDRYQRILRENVTHAELNWFHYKEAAAIEELSQKRLWSTPPPKSAFASASSSATPDPPPLILEDNPKWRSLLNVLQEIEIENSRQDVGLEPTPIVILVRDESMRHALSSYLTLPNPSQYLLSRLKGHIEHKLVHIANLRASRHMPKQQNFFADTKQGRRRPWSNAAKDARPSPPPPPTEDGEVIDVDAQEPLAEDLTPQELERHSLYLRLLDQLERLLLKESMPSLLGDFGANDHNMSNDYERHFGLVRSEVDPSTSLRSVPIIIQACDYSFSTIPSLLDDLRPHFVVSYDPEPGIVRQVECFKAANPTRFVRHYVMLYRESLEFDRFTETLRKEQQVMNTLIEQKGKLAPKDAETEADIIRRVIPNSGSSSRHGGGRSDLILGGGILSTAISQTPMATRILSLMPEELVIVDTREFRSKLPGMLHQHGVAILPVTLIIADYILSPDIAVERKSLSDLRMSLSNGRIHYQIENLTRLYDTPILLIEFDASEAFELNPGDHVHTGFTSSDLGYKLALLTKSFPKLRVLWSRSPAQTAQLFQALKKGKPQPNISFVSQHHASLGQDTRADSEESGTKDSADAKKFRSASLEQHNSASNLAPFYPIDILKRMPGLDKGTDWKPLLFPPASPTASRDASPTKSTFGSAINSTNTSPVRLGPTSSSAVSPTKTPTSAVPAEVPLDGSLFDVDDDSEEVEAKDALEDPELAPLSLPAKFGVAPSGVPEGPKAVASLSELASMSYEELEKLVGKKTATQLHQFLHHKMEKDSLLPLLGARALQETKKAKKTTTAKEGGKGKRAKSGGGGRFGGGPASTTHR